MGRNEYSLGSMRERVCLDTTILIKNDDGNDEIGTVEKGGAYGKCE